MSVDPIMVVALLIFVIGFEVHSRTHDEPMTFGDETLREPTRLSSFLARQEGLMRYSGLALMFGGLVGVSGDAPWLATIPLFIIGFFSHFAATSWRLLEWKR